jgi:hypothetical protein
MLHINLELQQIFIMTYKPENETIQSLQFIIVFMYLLSQQPKVQLKETAEVHGENTVKTRAKPG